MSDMPADQAMIRQEAGCSDIEANNKEVESYQHNAAADDEDSSSDVEDLHDSDDFPTCSGDEEEEEFVTPVLKPVIRVPKATKEDQLKFNQLIRNILKAFHVTEENFGVPPNQSVMFLTHNFYLWWLDRKLVPLDLNPRAPDIAKAVNEHIALFPSAIPFTGNDLLALVAWLDADGHPPRFMQNAGIPGEIDIRAADLDTQNLPAFLHRCKELNIMETHDKSGYNLLIRAVTTIIGYKFNHYDCQRYIYNGKDQSTFSFVARRVAFNTSHSTLGKLISIHDKRDLQVWLLNAQKAEIQDQLAKLLT